MKRFEIWDAVLPYRAGSHVQHGHRPCIIVSNNAANTYSPVVTIVPLTSQLRKKRLPTHVTIHSPKLHETGFAACEQIITLDKSDLIAAIDYVWDDSERAQLERALAIQLGMTAA